MKKIVCFLLVISLMLSLSVFSFADTLIPIDLYDKDKTSESNGITPYALVPPSVGLDLITGRSGNTITSVRLVEEDGLSVGSGGELIPNFNSSLSNCLLYGRSSGLPSTSPVWWFNSIARFIDANGHVISSSDISHIGIYISYGNEYVRDWGYLPVASDNTYQFDDGFLQFALSYNQGNALNNYGYGYFLSVSNPDIVSPISVEIETFDFYNYESSTTAYPFTFGSGAHENIPIVPDVKDPNDHTQYGDASDQVEWYNDAYGAAVNPDLGDKMSATTDMLLQEQEIEEQMIDGINQYAPAVNPANLTMPTQIVNGIRFIGDTFMGSYNALGDIGFVISFSMMLGVVLVLIGRGEGALARGMASSARERRRTEYASDRDMKKGG